MARYVRIRTFADDGATACYAFATGGVEEGRLSFDRRSGHVTLEASLAGDQRDRAFWPAAAKLRKHWQDGVLPDSTEFAS